MNPAINPCCLQRDFSYVSPLSNMINLEPAIEANEHTTWTKGKLAPVYSTGDC